MGITEVTVMKIRHIRRSGSENSPSLRIAIIKTMKGEKSNFHIKAMNINPNYK
ncbi:hypothetical protein Hanom_Chr06g00513091 [Helianthus anomalus]